MEGDLESLLTRGFFTGHPEKAMPETETMEVKSGDRILLCSDGMWSSMNPEILRDRMMDDKPLEDIMDTLRSEFCELDAERNTIEPDWEPDLAEPEEISMFEGAQD